MILGPRQWATDRTVILEGSGEHLPTTAFIADAKLLACLLPPLDPKGKNCVSVLFASLCTPRPHSPPQWAITAMCTGWLFFKQDDKAPSCQMLNQCLVSALLLGGLTFHCY